MNARWASALTAAVVAATSASLAHADECGGDRLTQAEALFDTGKALVNDGQLAEGCEQLKASEELCPALGTELHLADCYERLGSSASAWAMFRTAATSARRIDADDMEQLARERARSLEPKLSRLRIELSPEARVPGLMVRRNGVPAVPGASLPVDPGVSRLEVTAPGYQTYRTELTVEGPTERVVTIPPLIPVPPDPEPPEPIERRASSPHPARERGASGAMTALVTRERTTHAILAAAVGGAGLVGVGFGVGFGVRALQLKGRAQPGEPSGGAPPCSANGFCTDEGLSLLHEARQAGAWSTALLIGGSALTAAGLTIWLLAPEEATSSQARVELGAKGLIFRGTW